MKKYEAEVKGISPYLMHKFGLEESQLKTKPNVGSPDYATQAEDALYRLPDGTIYVPATQIHGALIEAGKQMKVVGKGKATYSKLFGSFIMLAPDALVMTNQNWEVDTRAVVVPATKGRIARHRPKFVDWGLKFELHILDDEIHESVVKEGLERAGNYAGIGDFRPQKKGPFGRFQVTSFKEVK